MATSTTNRDAPAVACRHHRTWSYRKRACREARQIVHSVDRVDGKAVKEPFLDHSTSAAETFLRGLKDEMHGAGEIGVFGQVARGTEEHCRVTIVSTGV